MDQYHNVCPLGALPRQIGYVSFQKHGGHGGYWNGGDGWWTWWCSCGYGGHAVNDDLDDTQ